MKLYGIKDGNHFLPIPNNRRIKMYGPDHCLASDLGTSKKRAENHLSDMQKLGVWLNAQVVEIK